jgi:hypothetical protein
MRGLHFFIEEMSKEKDDSFTEYVLCRSLPYIELLFNRSGLL